jgi:DNA-binding XRE family transcriptional regulator
MLPCYKKNLFEKILRVLRYHGEEMERNIQLNWQGFVQEAVKHRKEQKLTQEQLAILAGVSKPTLNSFEQGKTTIKLDSALKILKVLGLWRESES